MGKGLQSPTRLLPRRATPCPPVDGTADPIELGLVKLMNRAADAGEWEVVRELAARRKARTGIVDQRYPCKVYLYEVLSKL
jgi:hypothetical protein